MIYCGIHSFTTLSFPWRSSLGITCHGYDRLDVYLRLGPRLLYTMHLSQGLWGDALLLHQKKAIQKLSRKFHHTCIKDMHVDSNWRPKCISTITVIREQLHTLLSLNMRYIQSVALHFFKYQTCCIISHISSSSYEVDFALKTHTHIPSLCVKYEGSYHNDGVIFKVRIRLLVIRCLHFETDTAYWIWITFSTIV